jgi:hypothetical protein
MGSLTVTGWTRDILYGSGWCAIDQSSHDDICSLVPQKNGGCS